MAAYHQRDGIRKKKENVVGKGGKGKKGSHVGGIARSLRSAVKRDSHSGNNGPRPSPGHLWKQSGRPKCRLSGLHVNKLAVIFFMSALHHPLSKTRNVCDSEMK